ncbi:MAG: hypothetical protein FWE02_07895 [Defluviitaleaceae bacterium]|nr:hypothetical protein [Defluviitaleaceae bacterium]
MEYEKTYKRNENSKIADFADDKNYTFMIGAIQEIRDFFEKYSFLQFGRMITPVVLTKYTKSLFLFDNILMAVE